MAESRFVYVTYIRSTPEKLWHALIEPEFTRQYWLESWQESDWTPGAAWAAKVPGGKTALTGEVIESDPYKRLVYTWRDDRKPEVSAEGPSRVTYELREQGESVRLTVIHEIDRPESKLIKNVSGGWPLVLASLKSFLETGEALEATKAWVECN